MKDLIEALYLTNRGFVTDDYRECLAYIDENRLSLAYHTYESGTEIWDSWVVPPHWDVNEAFIEHDGERLLSYDDHPLHVISYSSSFEGTVSRAELVEHIYTHPKIPHAIPWHFRLNYRPWESEWGFCASKDFVEALDEGEYDVRIDTTFSDGEMTVAEHHIEGSRDETILLVAHLDHTGMANDDLSGVAVGLEVMNRLGERSDLRYSYKLLLVQEYIGTAAFLSERESAADQYAFGIFLEMLGNDNRILLQRSFTGDTKLDAVAEFVLASRDGGYEVDDFRSQIGNDELILEAPGYEIPTISLNRFPYEEYHTHLDNPSIISESRLEESAQIVCDIVDILERDFVPVRTFTGVPSLANPKYDLYIDPGQFSGTHGDTEDGIHAFRNRLFRCLEGDRTVFDIADEFGVAFGDVYDYLVEFEEKDLIRIKYPE